MRFLLTLILLVSTLTYAQDASRSNTETEIIYGLDEVDQKPGFNGGDISKFYSYLGDRIIIPDVNGLKGKIFVEVVVEKDGSLSNFKLLEDIGHGMGKQVIKILKQCPKWKPSTKDGLAVRTKMILPITIHAAN